MAGPLPLIETLCANPTPEDVEGLVELLVQTVQSGAAVTFLASAPRSEVHAYWQGILRSANRRTVVLVARRGDTIIGTVQVQPVRANNQQHRAEIAKLMVHPSARRSGLGRALMEAAEAEATRVGFRLLTLDTRTGDVAEALYLKLGWTRVGSIPKFALNPDGVTFNDATIFYKELEPGPG